MSSLDPNPVYVTISRIPAGRVCSYGEVARLSGHPGKGRWVGQLLSRLPADSTLPWHRVVNAGGKVTCPKSSLAQERLAGEGITFHNGKIDMSRLAWP
jgi:methylated-DNA-protein-cysteine methyltransferase-like protein